MRLWKPTVVVAAMVTPMVLAMPGVLATGGDSMSDQEQDYREAHAANVEQQQQANHPGNRPTSHAPCVGGVAKGTDFTCDRVDLLAHVPLAELGTTFGNDVWGWTAPDGKREWALVGGGEGTAFVEVTDPKRPVVTGFLPTAGAGDAFFWRDIKTVNDHAYIVTEDTGAGMQVFDLTRLLDAEPGTEFEQDGWYGMVSNTHNIVSHEDSDTVYLVGTDTCQAGLHAVDVSDPADPTFAGCFEDHGYVHDAQCVTYDGPDSEHRGKTICVSAVSNVDGDPFVRQELSVVDMTDPMDPQPLSLLEYGTGFGYSHQGWLTEDHSTWIHGDELDEAFGAVETTTTYVFDLTDLDAPSLTGTSTNGETSIDHNLFVDNGYVLAGNYTTGLRVFDGRDAADGELPEVAWFDTYPANDDATFEGGVWGTYPYFEQPHLVAVSTIDGGLFLLKPRVGESR